MWNRTVATTAAVIALIAASCGHKAEVGTSGTVPEVPAEAVTESIEIESPSDVADLVPIAPPRDIATEAATAAPEPDPRWPAMLADARDSVIAGQCERAVELFDELLADDAWVATSSVVNQVRSERSGCADLLAVGDHASGAADTMTAYLQFLDQHPDTPLATIVVSEIRQLFQTAGSEAISADSCDAIDGDFDLFAAPTTDVVLACASAYGPAGHVANASALATEVLNTTEDVNAIQSARRILLQDPSTCVDLANGVEFVDPAERPDTHAALLQSCMKTAAGELDQLALLQITFLVDLPQHDAAATIEAEMIENVAACDLLSVMENLPTFSDRRDLIATKTFECAQFASFVGDIDAAIDRYESFLDQAADDPRFSEAEAGLARNLIAEAKLGVTSEFERPARSGNSGGGHAQLLFSNDTVYDQRVIIVGPESRIVTVEASSVSSTYAQRPTGCRTDVPSVTIELVPGTYEVMIYDDVAAPEIGTWTLESGTEYGWCAFYVRA